MVRRILVVSVCSLFLLAMGASPRYLEELRIGGGYGDVVNGGVDFDKSGNISTDGSLKAGGSIESGVGSSFRGICTAWNGAGGTAPGALRLGSSNGTLGYVFMSDDRSGLRISSSLPTSNSDGDWLKAKTVTDLGAPPAIGGTTPSTGKFTTLDATGNFRTGGSLLSGSATGTPEARLHVKGGSCGFSDSRNYRTSDGVLVENDGDVLMVLQGLSGSLGEIWFGDTDDEAAGRIRYDHSTDTMWFYVGRSERLSLSQYGNAELMGDLSVDGGEITAGIAGETRGVLMACRGAGVNTAGVLKLAAADGTLHYYFAESDGTLKVSNGLPSGDSSGTEVGAQFSSTITTFAANDTTPSVSGGVVFQVPVSWSSGNNVTMLDSGVAGQMVIIIGGDSDCVFEDGDRLKLAGNWTAVMGWTLTLVFDGTNWREIARSNN